MNFRPPSVLKPVSTSSQEIVFIDRGVEDFEFLEKGVRPGVEVHLLEADAIVQMTAVLSERKGLKAVHVVSHGAPGCLYLGEGELSLSRLGQYEAELRSWFAGYAEGEKPELLLYGCNVAAGDAGEEFVSQLVTLTGVTPQASRVKVGAPKAGGVWQLNYGQPQIQPVELFSVETKQAYSAAFASGDLDTSFGNGGKVTAGFDGSAGISSSIIDADGNILIVGGGGLLARYTSSGQLDTTFGTDGKVVVGGGQDITIDTEGNILVGGSQNSDFAVWRYASDGQLDTSFGTGGTVTTDFDGKYDSGLSIVLDSAGSIFVSGSNAISNSIYGFSDFALASYTSDGQLDTSFGTGGKVTTDFERYRDNGSKAPTSDFGSSVAIDDKDNILVAGSSDWGIRSDFKSTGATDEGDEDFALARYTSNGQLDLTFGNGGQVTTDFFNGSEESGNSATIDAAGNILVAGRIFRGSISRWDFVLARYTSEGQLDTSFGTDGTVITSFEKGEERGESIVIDAVGNILVAGNAGNDFALARYTNSGQLDPSFGIDGKVTTSFDGNPAGGSSVTIDAAGDIFVAGRSSNGIGDDFTIDYDFAIAKYDGSTSPLQVGLSWNTQTGAVSSLVLSATAANTTLTRINRTITDTDWALQTVGDMDGNGQDDVLLRHSISGQNLVGYMTPGGQSIESEALIGRNVEDSNWSIVGTGDFNADGKTDIIWQNQAADQILAWYMDGQGNIEDEAIIGRDIGDSDWKVEAVADFGGDGKADMLLRNGISGQIILWEMDGDTIIEESLFGREVSDINWAIEGARDFDNNGTMDVLLRNAAAEQTALWSMADKNIIGSEILISNVPGATSQIAF